MKTTQQTKSTAHYRQGRDFRQLALTPRLWRHIHFKNKRCSKCKEIKPFSEFSKDRNKKDGFRSECKFCQKRYFQSEKGKITQRAGQNCFNVRCPEHRKVGNAVNNAIRDNKLSRANTLQCTYCPVQAAHYHHPDYSKPLEVIPVCRKCHTKIHASWRSIIDRRNDVS